MWIIQTLKHQDGYWTRCASSDEGGGFHEGCQHKHPTLEEAEACEEANIRCGQISGFPWMSPAERAAEIERQQRGEYERLHHIFGTDV